MEQPGSKSGKQYIKDVNCHPAYFTYTKCKCEMKCEMLGWMKHKLESRQLENISNLRYADDTTMMAEIEELKSFLMKVIEESEKVDLQLNIQKTKIMASGPITSWQRDGETVDTVADFFFWLQNHCRW